MGEIIRLCTILVSLVTVVCSDFCVKKEFNALECNYIPVDIPTNISNVKIVDFIRKNSRINSSFFQSENWGRIKFLELNDETSSAGDQSGFKFFAKCFSGLKMLNTLKIRVTGYIDYLDSGIFLGLNNVKTLDLSDCTRVSLKLIVPALRGIAKLPRLQELLLSNLGNNIYPSSFDSSFSQSLKSKNVTLLDASRLQISMFNFTSVTQDLNQLKVLNLSYSVISDTDDKGNTVSDLTHIDIVDVSHAVFPKAWTSGPVGKILIANYTIKDLDPRDHLERIFAIKVINATGLISVPNSVWIENCKTNLDKPFVWHSKGIIARHNNIKRLDIEILCSKYKATNFEHVDISYNSMEFIHPSIFSCAPALSKLDLSGNQLYKMVKESSGLFGELFQTLTHLFWINLSNNNLESIPTRLFENNSELEEIDLSDNKICQITFNLRNLKKLRVLDLRSNQLNVLDDISIRTLNSIPKTSSRRNSSPILLLGDNPFSCSTCLTKRSVQFLITTPLLNITLQHLTCSNEVGNKDIVTTETMEMIQKICNRKTIIISTSTSVGVLSLIIGASVFVLYKRKKHARMMAKLERVLQNLTEGQDQFEFVTFLSLSSDDKNFVETWVYNQLNENLQTMTGIERNLVCTGDEYLRPGFLILDETVRCIERASLVIVVVSNSYCGSRYCHNELDQAYRLNKPIILMLKEHVDEERMMPTMKMIFKSNVRILWTIANQEYVPNTTWKNICSSVLELIVHEV